MSSLCFRISKAPEGKICGYLRTASNVCQAGLRYLLCCCCSAMGCRAVPLLSTRGLSLGEQRRGPGCHTTARLNTRTTRYGRPSYLLFMNFHLSFPSATALDS